MKMLGARAMCLAATLAVAACGVGADNAGIVPIFDQVVFGNGHLKAPLGIVYRWERPVRVAARGKRTAASVAALKIVLAEIADAAPLDVAFLDGPEDPAANIVVFLEDGDAYLNYLSRQGALVNHSRRVAIAAGFCWSITWTVGDQIDRAAVFIDGGNAPGEAARRTRNCLYHEMAHAIGLAYHPSDAFSIINHESFTARFTRVDRMLLAVLYAPRMAAGTARAEALRTAGEFLSRRSRRD